jgi:hypothetical protein
MIDCGGIIFVRRRHIWSLQRDDECRPGNMGALFLDRIGTIAGEQSPPAAPPQAVGDKVREVDGYAGSRR